MLSHDPQHSPGFAASPVLQQDSYRPAVGLLVLNQVGHVWVGQRHDSREPAWQMPQGGILSHEPPYDAALRELFEETSIRSVSFLATTACWYTYDFPHKLAERFSNQKYIGQRQRWFAFRFTGADSEINLDTLHPEFSDWRWAAPVELPGLAAPFKRELYQQLVSDFRDILA